MRYNQAHERRLDHRPTLGDHGPAGRVEPASELSLSGRRRAHPGLPGGDRRRGPGGRAARSPRRRSGCVAGLGRSTKRPPVRRRGAARPNGARTSRRGWRSLPLHHPGPRRLRPRATLARARRPAWRRGSRGVDRTRRIMEPVDGRGARDLGPARVLARRDVVAPGSSRQRARDFWTRSSAPGTWTRTASC